VLEFLLSQASPVLDAFSDTDTIYGRMIYRDALPLRLKGTGKRAIILTSAPGSPYGNTTAYSGSVNVKCYADHSRTPVTGEVPVEDGVDRAYASWGLVDKLLQKVPPLSSSDPFIQTERTSNPLESYDSVEDLPVVVCIYDVAVLVTV
jgi:hypothetical protein